MSYDIQVWSVNPIDLSDFFSEDNSWKHEDPFWVKRTYNWQIVITPPVKVLDEDLPEGADAALPGIRYLVDINLEPISAPKSSFNLMTSIANKISKETKGIVFNQQTGSLITPRGVKRYTPKKRDELFSYIKLSWWFTEGPLQTDAGIVEFVDLIESLIPEALPRRYGLFEPPQYLFKDEGKENFIQFLINNKHEGIIWYPNRPVIGVYVFCPDRWGIIGKNFRARQITMSIESTAMMQDGWSTALKKFWKKASHIIEPFYGDVRTIENAVRMGSTYGSGKDTGFHPVFGPWWTGIPKSLGHAAVIGSPYIELWPKLIEKADIENNLAFASSDSWLSKKDIARIIGGVPKGIAQTKEPKKIVKRSGKGTLTHIEWNKEYPTIWPF